MADRRMSVKRETNARYSLFGPERWWGVWLTPFQQVAAFQYQYDAMTWAVTIAEVIKRKAEAKEGTE